MLRSWGAFPIKRNSGDVSAFKEAFRRLKQRCPIVYFPEGTRRRKGASTVEILSGIGFLAIKGKVSVIPAFVRNSDKVLPPGAKFFKRHSVIVMFGKPLEFSSGEEYTGATRQIMQAIKELEHSHQK